MSINDEIGNIVKNFNQLPYLFVGTGLSMRYSNAPSWNELLFNIWKEIHGEDEKRYKKYVNKVSYELKMDKKDISEEKRKYFVNPELATRIQTEFNDAFYNNNEFEKKVFSKEQVEEIVDKDYDPFKYYIAIKTNNINIDKSKKEFDEIGYITDNQNKIAGIITTNYDNQLEELFKDFEVIIGQNSLLTANTNNFFEIYKIHGSCKKPNSIVITREDYEYFDKKLKYLSAKLLTLFVEHPIIFIGYGIGDINIRKILEQIAQCLDKDQLELIKNNFIFVNPAFGVEDSISSKELDFDGKRIIMTEITLNDFSLLFKEFQYIKSALPVKIMRKMQDMICNFIVSTKPSNNVVVGSINSEKINDKDLGVYIGNVESVSSMGFDSYKIDDIIEDILFDDKPYLMNEKLITGTFKVIRASAGNTFLPIYKYINGLNYNKDKIDSSWKIINAIQDVSLNISEERIARDKKQYNKISDIVTAYSYSRLKELAYIKLNLKNINVDELGNYLRQEYKKGELLEQKYLSTFKKLVAAYDFLKYNKKA